ncbi:(d)CMP kinase [Croceicoccus naphthovorans]|uniref:Cytidylate kinase n=1 Tax=Croceicoccus naphthovorans TaxID=1348774 RepID=A0A0G3XMB1_9SPHN|nr:d(CMP) kinase [Croceicoccus naphthovorans]AKM11593.1 cytidylate kinase [Croceicoccus naphthovorans]
MVIAVDGPTASGKGTIARGLAKHYGLAHLDTGLLYRAVGMQARMMGIDPDDPLAAVEATGFPDSLLKDPELRGENVGALASRVSVHKRVRAALLERQREFAARPGGAVLDGRDIGTVIAPDADVKLFVTASVEARAQRRHAEMVRRGQDVTLDAIREDLIARDARDRNRAEAPLVEAPDAVTLDNSNLNAAQSLAEAIRIVDDLLARKAAE